MEVSASVGLDWMAFMRTSTSVENSVSVLGAVLELEVELEVVEEE